MPLPTNITELALVASANPHAPCPAHFARIDAGPSWDGDFGAASHAFLCAGSSGSAPQITGLRAVAAPGAAEAVCPEGYEPVPGGNFNGPQSSQGYIGLCFTRSAALGGGINTLEGRAAVSGCPAGLAAVGGHRVGPAPPPPNATVCHGFVCTAAQQGALCPKGTPGAADRDFRCCDDKWVSGTTPNSPAPQCKSSTPPDAKSCPGYVCTAAQERQLCRRGTPGAADRDFRCCNLKWVSGKVAGSPAPNCSGAELFEFKPEAGGIVLCEGYIKPCPPARPASGAITRLLPITGAYQSELCCPAGDERVAFASGEPVPFTQTNPPPGHDFTYLCAGRAPADPEAAAITAMTAFATPSAADPNEDCPAGWHKVNNASVPLGTGATGGPVFLCSKQTAGGTPLTGLLGVRGNASAACPSGTTAVPGTAASPGPFLFDSSGVGAQLCASHGATRRPGKSDDDCPCDDPKLCQPLSPAPKPQDEVVAFPAWELYGAGYNESEYSK